MRDEALSAQIQRGWEENFRVNGARKVWKQLNREGQRVARCTVERLMRSLGLRGAVRGGRVKTTIREAQRELAQDRVHRTFKVSRPNALWVADLSYVATWRARLRGLRDRCVSAADSRLAGVEFAARRQTRT